MCKSHSTQVFLSPERWAKDGNSVSVNSILLEEVSTVKSMLLALEGLDGVESAATIGPSLRTEDFCLFPTNCRCHIIPIDA